MDLARIGVVRERIAGFAVTQMIVVRADRYPPRADRRRRRRRREKGDDVLASPLLAENGDVELQVHVWNRKAGDVRICRVERLLRVLQRLVRVTAEDLFGFGAADARRDDARARERRVERHRHELAGVRRSRSGDDEHCLCAALTRHHRFIAEVRVARQDSAGLLIRVFGEVAKHEDDLVLDVQRRVAVVAEILALWNDNPVAGEHNRTAHVAVVGERQRACRRRLRADGQLRSAIFGAGRELKRQPEILLTRQRLRADLFQLGDNVVRSEPLAIRSRKTAFQAFGCQRLNMRTCL